MATPTAEKDIDAFLSDIIDLCTRKQALFLLLNRLEKDLPQCHAKDMIRGKIRKHIAQADLEIQRSVQQMQIQWNFSD